MIINKIRRNMLELVWSVCQGIHGLILALKTSLDYSIDSLFNNGNVAN